MNKSIKKLALVSAISAISASGAHAASYSARIIGGADAPVDTYPWMVSVQSKEEGEHFCGGSLIADKYVLTAAHCLEDAPAEEVQVVISEFDLSSSSAAEETISAKSIYIHEGYGEEDDHDIAIIELETSSAKDPVRLADASFMAGLNTGDNLTVMGWGNMSTDGESFPNILQEVQVPLADHQQCKTNYQNVDIDITDNMICAGLPAGGKDSCQGDSGGPLVYQKDSHWYQTGVVSFGEGCAEPDYFGVYTKVSQYENWLAQVQAGEVAPFEPDLDDDEWDDGHDDSDDYDDWDGEYDEHDEYDEWDDEEDEEELQAFEIPEYLDFLASEEDESVEESLFVFNTEESPLSIQGISLDNDQHFSIVENGCDAVTLNQEEECEVVLAYDVSGEEGDYHEAALTIATSDAEHPQIEVALFGEVLDELELEDGFDGIEGMDDEEWYFDGDDAWTSDEEDGSFTLATDAVAENDEAMLMTILEGPGVLEFDMSLRGDAAGNTLSFAVDGEVVSSLSSDRASKSHTVELSEGEHEIAWIYRKTEASGPDAEATVSDIEYEPEHDEAYDDEEGEFSDDDLSDVLSDEETQEAVETLSEAISGAGSTDAFLLALLALMGIKVRSNRK